MTSVEQPLPNTGVTAILATLDTKGDEVEYLRRLLTDRGAVPWVIDTGIMGSPATGSSVSREAVASSGGSVLARLRAAADPATGMKVMAAGARRVLADLDGSGTLHAVIGVAGGKGAALFAAATADLPITTLKVLVSSARADVLARIASTSTTVIFPTLVDLMGLNHLTRQALHGAAVLTSDRTHLAKPETRARAVAVTAFGVTTIGAMACVAQLQGRGIETLVFPANGAGGTLLERLISEGRIAGVVDLTTTELADELVGGVASAGPDRLRAAGRARIPHWVAPGATDMVNFGPASTVPARFTGRLLYQHSDYTTLLRTSPDECQRIGESTAGRLSAGAGARQVCWTGGGFSDYDRPGRPFYDPAADRAWLDGVKGGLAADVEISELDVHINHPDVATRAVEWMTRQLAADRSVESLG